MKFAATIEGIPGITVRIAVTDAVQQFAAVVYTVLNSPAISIIISCEEETVRFAYGVDPTQGANPVGHPLYPGVEMEIKSGRAIREFRFINETALQNGVLQVTPMYKIGV